MSKKVVKRLKQPSMTALFKTTLRKGGITEYVLKTNGLRVLHVPIPESDTVTTCMVYGVGSQHEGRGETGLAHMLEHMLFKDTGTNGATWKTLEERGAILNATTWLDRTTYYFNLPKEYLRDMLHVEADRMRNVKLTKKEFEPERANVQSEYEMNNSDPITALDWDIVSTAFQSHGYKHDTIGFKSDIERYTPEKLKSFYDRFYWPNNATLIVVGGVNVAELMGAVHETFHAIPGRFALDTQESIPELPQEGERRVVLERDTPIRALTLAYKAPAFTSREWTSLYLALLHLTDGKTSVLYRALVDSGLATGVTGSMCPTKDPFLAFICITASENSSYEKIERIVDTHLASLSKKMIPAKRVHELTAHAHASELFSRDGTLNIATQLAEYVASGNWKRYEDGLTELMGITPEDIRCAVEKYFRASARTVGVIQRKTKP